MKKAALIFVMLISLPVGSALAEPLNNENIISLVRAGIGEDAIVAKIKASEGQYETSVKDLIHLKKANVPSRIMTAMIESPGKKTDAASQSWSIDARDPMVPRPPGVYVLTNRTLTAKMLPIIPTSSRHTKSGGFWSYALTGGIAAMSFKAIVPGTHARIELRELKPIFYFYFDQNGQSSSSSFWTSDSFNAPTDFALIRFDVKNDHREKKVGRYNITGIKSGLAEKDKIPFTYSLISPGVFEVIPVIDLVQGEYGFVLGSSQGGNMGISNNVGLNNKIFDFSVKQPI